MRTTELDLMAFHDRTARPMKEIHTILIATHRGRLIATLRGRSLPELEARAGRFCGAMGGVRIVTPEELETLQRLHRTPAGQRLAISA